MLRINIAKRMFSNIDVANVIFSLKIVYDNIFHFKINIAWEYYFIILLYIIYILLFNIYLKKTQGFFSLLQRLKQTITTACTHWHILSITITCTTCGCFECSPISPHFFFSLSISIRFAKKCKKKKNLSVKCPSRHTEAMKFQVYE